MQIDVYHDTVCPWCRIGKRHLKLALEQWQGNPVTINYHTFFLNDTIPQEGYEFKSYMQAKVGGRIPIEQMFERPRAMGEQVGLNFNFEAIKKALNSSRSHQLIALAPEEKREAVIDAVYTAYFEHGQDISDIEVLVEIVSAQGMDAGTTRTALLEDAKRDEVMMDYQTAQQMGITGVPFFIMVNKLAFSGAQPPELILRALAQAQDLAHEEA